MKHSGTVKIEKQVNIRFNENINWNELIDDFNKYMFEADMGDIIRFCMARIGAGDYKFIDGIGPIEFSYDLNNVMPKNTVLFYNFDDVNIKAELN